jgi:hypothetical protein
MAFFTFFNIRLKVTSILGNFLWRKRSTGSVQSKSCSCTVLKGIWEEEAEFEGMTTL